MMQDSRPNILVFITDDQGYGDLSCMGATDFRTPNLDRLAADGVRFTSWYSNSPVCSPARASLLTGRYPGNAGVRSILAGHRTATGLPSITPTIADVLKKEGYQTAMFGKWHLGLAEGSRPEAQGFDTWFGFMAGCVDYFSHIFYWGMNRGGPGNDPTHDLWDEGEESWEYNGEYFTELMTRKAVEYIREAAQEDAPFFTYVAYNAPHYPMHAPKKYMDRFPDLPWDRQIMAAMLSAVDDGVGAIMDELDRQGVRENTLVVFVSDNGPSRETRNWLDGTQDPYYGGTAGKLKGHKFSLYEGGIRVPGIVTWPEKIEGGQVVDDPAAAMDVLPTVLQAAGGNPADYELDGVDLLPWLAEGDAAPERTFFWEMSQQTAVRRGPWKLVLNGVLVEGTEPEDDVHLANLEEDLGERENLIDVYPDLTAELKAEAEAWRDGIEVRWETEWKPIINGTTGFPTGEIEE
jgi:arylsulfatase A-like enzyme